MGDPNAPVKIVEYSDFQCPYCAVFWKDTESKIVEAYVKTGKVYFTYRVMGNWVSDNINQGAGTSNKESQNAGLAAYCAGDQNKFWEYHDILFTNQNGENQGFFARQYLDAFAEKLGLDMVAFKSCMDAEKYTDLVLQGKVDGVKDITSAADYDGKGYGTPSFLINGKLIPGAARFEAFQQVIEAALTAAGQ
jgi:protein-disulfide isomerase